MPTQAVESHLKSFVRDIPDFPKPGILFKDITPLIRNAVAFRAAVDALIAPFRDKKITHIVCVEARGFIFGSAAATALGAGFVPIRKQGKLPYRTFDVAYDLEYGTGVLSMHQDALGAEDRVLIVDDLLATGGTVGAVAKLIEQCGAKIEGITFLVELEFLAGRAKLGAHPAHSVLKY
ncbi:MAG: adenine phosphoribosyltransferase [Candidatus Omnitrophica bacterium]|nr:adenine phosphoribosyltransferase [Candidatus Omnitrophota bacterium]